MRPDDPLYRCSVSLVEDDRIAATEIASRYRSDLAAREIGDGCHSFVISLPSTLFDGTEHILSVVETETGLSLTADPIRWRAEQVLGHTIEAAAGKLGSDRLFGLRSTLFAPTSPATREDDEGLVVRQLPAVNGLHRSSDIKERVTTVPVVGTRVLFDVSDLIYYIGEHANLTGIQRVR